MGGRQFSGTQPLKIANSQISFSQKSRELLLVLFNLIHKNSLVWMKVVLQSVFCHNFLILADFAAFLDHTRETADVSNNGGYY